MKRRLLAPLVLCVALLTQLLAPVSAAGQMARMGSDVDGVECEMHAHHAGSKAAPVQAPAGGAAQHDHASCVFCQLGASASPAFEAPAPDRVHAPAIRIVFTPFEREIRVFSFNRNAPARAPPSFV